jgi:hypothetical protein
VKFRSATANLAPHFTNTAPTPEQMQSSATSQAAQPELTTLPPGADRGFTFAILLSALRCTAQYVLLPFVLPWLGVAASIPPWLTLALSAIALISLTRNLRYLWRMRYSRRWSYLGLALVVGIGLLIFVGVDLSALLR